MSILKEELTDEHQHPGADDAFLTEIDDHVGHMGATTAMVVIALSSSGLETMGVK